MYIDHVTHALTAKAVAMGAKIDDVSDSNCSLLLLQLMRRRRTETAGDNSTHYTAIRNVIRDKRNSA